MALPPQTVALLQAARQLVETLPADAVCSSPRRTSTGTPSAARRRCRLLVAAEDCADRASSHLPRPDRPRHRSRPDPTQERMSLALLEAVRSEKLHTGPTSSPLQRHRGRPGTARSGRQPQRHPPRRTPRTADRQDLRRSIRTCRWRRAGRGRPGAGDRPRGPRGPPVGTMFVVGDTRKVLTMCRPMNFNPFRGYSPESATSATRGARADQGHRPARRRHRHPPRRRGRGGVHAHQAPARASR